MRIALACFLACLALIALPGCDDNPCGRFMPAGKVVIPTTEDDGTEVEVDGRPAVCQDGEPVFTR